MNYTKREYKQEQEANQFAMCLLMPSHLFIPEWEQLKKQNIEEEKQVTMLADLFQVPLWACTIRMSQLGSEFNNMNYDR